jgi:hypothetical protein
MKDIGYPQDAIALVGNIYSQSTTTFVGEYFDKTQPILIQRGIIHGDPQAHTSLLSFSNHFSYGYNEEIMGTYVYIGVKLVSSLQWKTQTHITITKLIKQCKLLVTCPATIKQKMQMVDTVIQAGIAYSFYAVPYSLPTINKLDREIIALHKTICGLPKYMSNAITQLPHGNVWHRNILTKEFIHHMYWQTTH